MAIHLVCHIVLPIKMTSTDYYGQHGHARDCFCVNNYFLPSKAKLWDLFHWRLLYFFFKRSNCMEEGMWRWETFKGLNITNLNFPKREPVFVSTQKQNKSRYIFKNLHNFLHTHKKSCALLTAFKEKKKRKKSAFILFGSPEV